MNAPLSHVSQKPTSRAYAIGDLSREFGVTHRTLRFYEQRGLLSPRRKGKDRVYNVSDCERLSLILKAKQLGFTLAEISAMLAKGQGPGSSIGLELSPDQVESQIAHLETRRAEVDRALAELRAQLVALSTMSDGGAP